MPMIPSTLYNSISNICLLTAEEDQLIGARRPRAYLGEAKSNASFFQRKMNRHLIPADNESGIWSKSLKGGFKQMVQTGTEWIGRGLEAEAGIKPFRRGI